jgi:hypothetical protein
MDSALKVPRCAVYGHGTSARRLTAETREDCEMSSEHNNAHRGTQLRRRWASGRVLSALSSENLPH